jgi:uncharacterized protein YdhG (YjbR/CyaY superfamily)
MYDQKIPIRTFDDWVLQYPEAQQDALIKLYVQIKKAAPKATDKMSYGVWCFYHQGMLVGMGAFKKHCSLFVMSYKIAKTKELIKAGIKGSTLQFTPEKPLPAALVKSIVKMRLKENESRKQKRETKK